MQSRRKRIGATNETPFFFFWLMSRSATTDHHPLHTYARCYQHVRSWFFFCESPGSETNIAGGRVTRLETCYSLFKHGANLANADGYLIMPSSTGGRGSRHGK